MEAHRAVEQSRSANVRILKKVQQLKEDGLTQGDWKILKGRLSLVWSRRNANLPLSTDWRQTCAQTRYIEVQDVNAHLFLALILTISPTECTQKKSVHVVRSLCRLKSYEAYLVNLKPTDKALFESIATEAGFSENHRYKSFMKALFPEGA
jgi:hypothetical protein